MYLRNEKICPSLDGCADEELCRRAVHGDGEAEEVLVRRYYSVVRACARALFLAGGDGEDLIQEGMFGLIQAIREFRENRSTSFHTFAEVCIRNRLYSALRTAARDKNAPLNQSVSLDHPLFDSNSYTPSASDVSHIDPELLIADRDYVERVLENTRKQLSKFEAKILGYYLDGLSCQEIAKIVGRNVKSVDNAVQRVRRKTARQLYSGDISIS